MSTTCPKSMTIFPKSFRRKEVLSPGPIQDPIRLLHMLHLISRVIFLRPFSSHLDKRDGQVEPCRALIDVRSSGKVDVCRLWLCEMSIVPWSWEGVIIGCLLRAVCRPGLTVSVVAGPLLVSRFTTKPLLSIV